MPTALWQIILPNSIKHGAHTDNTAHGWNSLAPATERTSSSNNHGFNCLFYSKAGEPGVRSTDGSCADLHVNYETTSYRLRAWKNSLNFHLSNGKAYSLSESTAVKKEVRLVSSGSSKQSIYTSWKMFLKLFFKRTGRFISTARKEEDTYLWD